MDLLVGDGNGKLALYGNMQMSGSNRISFDQGISEGLPTVSAGAVPFVADWNNDGRKDLIVGDADGKVTLFTNDGTEQAPSFDLGADLLGVASTGLDAAPTVIDFDADGLKDLLVAYSNEPIKVFLNTGTDAEPVLVADSTIDFGAGVDSVMPVDWDADGDQELAVASGGVVTVYSRIDGMYQVVARFSDRRADYVAAFPIALDGSGKQMLIGQADGQIVYLTGNSTEPVSSFQVALLAKVEELAGLVDASLLGEVSVIQALIVAGDYAAAADATSLLIAKLSDAAALQSASELLALL